MMITDYFSKLNTTDDSKHKNKPCQHLLLSKYFSFCVKGYHVINNYPIKESIWESLNAEILRKANIAIYSESDGSHHSGMDIFSEIGRFSNKTAKSTNKMGISISSYRLTGVCETPRDFILEIKRRCNFDYYSVLVRNDTSKEYTWYLIPSNHPIMDPDSYTWIPMMSKKNPLVQTGWKTKTSSYGYMSIQFNMSSQLWVHIKNTSCLDAFIIGHVTIASPRIMTYIDLYMQTHS